MCQILLILNICQIANETLRPIRGLLAIESLTEWFTNWLEFIYILADFICNSRECPIIPILNANLWFA